MELRQLRYFLAVADDLNFRKAAERLHMTQPPLSRQIRQLEEELGVELLVRDRNMVHLTESGKFLAQKARGLLAEADEIAAAVARPGKVQVGALRVGVGIALGFSIRPLVTEYARQFPGIDVQYQDLASSEQNRALRTREIDIALVWPPVDSNHLVCERMFDEHFRVVLPKTSPLAKRKALRLNDLADETLLLPTRAQAISDKVLQMYRSAGVTPKVLRTASSPLDAGAQLVASGKGIFILPGVAREFPSFGGGIAVVPLEEPVTIKVYMAWRKGETSAAIRNFLETARQVFSRTALHAQRRQT